MRVFGSRTAALPSRVHVRFVIVGEPEYVLVSLSSPGEALEAYVDCTAVTDEASDDDVFSTYDLVTPGEACHEGSGSFEGGAIKAGHAYVHEARGT